MSFTTIEDLFWAAGFIGHLALLLVLVVRRRVHAFPVFTSLLAYQTGVTVALFLISRYGSVHAYFLGYWLLALGDYAFQIALIFEIARNVLRPTGTWVRDARKGFLLWAALGTFFAGGLSLALSPPGVTGLDLWSIRATVFTSLLTCEVFLAMSGAANRMGLQWGSHVISLGWGLTVWAIVALLSNVGHFALKWKPDLVVFDRVRMIAYLGALLFWMVAFWRPETRRSPLPAEMQEYLIALHRRVAYDLDGIKSVDRPPL